MIIYLSVIGYLAYKLIHYLKLDFTNLDSVEINYLVALGTVAIALFAYHELNKSNKQTRNNFISYISNRWGSSETIEARQIIHDIYSKYRLDNNDSTYEEAVNEVSKKVLEMSDMEGEEGKKFIVLLSLLDYFETLGYFYADGNLDKTDIKNVCGNNLKFIHGIFSLYISKRRKTYKNDFSNFEKLYYDICIDEI